MKKTLILLIQILILVATWAYNADAHAAISDCRIGEAGVVGGKWASLVIYLNGTPVKGVQNFHELAGVLQQANAQGACQPRPQDCQLTSAGVTSSGQFFQHRLLVNGEALMGGNNLAAVIDQRHVLRRLNLCH